MKKSILSIFVVIAVMCSFLSIATSAASNKKQTKTKTYALPLATTAPAIDGALNDAAWNGNTLTVNFSSISDIVANGGYVKNSTAQTGATGVMKAVWSNESGKEGLYFCWDVKDSTQSWAADVTSNQFNAMDAAQVFIDPLNLKYSTVKNCAMAFSFVAYTSAAGNGMCPTEGAAWYEHWVWVGNQAVAGVEIASWINGTPDTIQVADIDRKTLLDHYIIEVRIPVKALNVNNREPELKVGTQMGVGFTLIDYDWLAEVYANDKSDIPASQKLINLYADFGDKRDRLQFPKYYNTMELTDESGVLAGSETTTPGAPQEVGEGTTQAYADSATAYAALKTELDTSKSITDNEKVAEYYNEDGVKALKEAVEASEGLTDANTVDELSAAITNVKNARLALECTKTLQELIDAVKALNESDYDSGDWTSIQDQVTVAEGFVSDENADKEEVAAAQLSLVKILAAASTDEKVEANEENDNKAGADGIIEDKESFPVWGIVLIIVAVIAVIAVIVIVAVKKKKSAAPAEETTPEETTTETTPENTDQE